MQHEMAYFKTIFCTVRTVQILSEPWNFWLAVTWGHYAENSPILIFEQYFELSWFLFNTLKLTGGQASLAQPYPHKPINVIELYIQNTENYL